MVIVQITIQFNSVPFNNAFFITQGKFHDSLDSDTVTALASQNYSSQNIVLIEE